MKDNYKTIAAIIAITLILSVIFTPICLANSNVTPLITIIVPNAPDDIDITLNYKNGRIYGYKVDKFMESQFHFYNFDCRKDTVYTINVSYGNVSQVVALAATSGPVLNKYELDYKNLIAKVGVSRKRVNLYTILRIILILLIQSVVFYLFGFRKKKSWLIFLSITFVIQSIFNMWYSSYAAPEFYMIMILIFGAVFVFLFEGIAMVMIIQEKRETITFASVMIANLLSFTLIGLMMPYMPFVR
ncbi:MAG: hypothetical protein R3232_04715 [Clostridia bacterium]|nr:hypothetical protein [Clostridia bacterium]